MNSLEFIIGFESMEIEYMRHQTDESHEYENPYLFGTEERAGYDAALEYYEKAEPK